MHKNQQKGKHGKRFVSLNNHLLIKYLAVMDFNFADRTQATTKTCDLRYKQPYSKVKQNWVVKKIPEQKQSNYLPSVMQEIALQKSLVKSHFATHCAG